MPEHGHKHLNTTRFTWVSTFRCSPPSLIATFWYHSVNSQGTTKVKFLLVTKVLRGILQSTLTGRLGIWSLHSYARGKFNWIISSESIGYSFHVCIRSFNIPLRRIWLLVDQKWDKKYGPVKCSRTPLGGNRIWSGAFGNVRIQGQIFHVF